MIDLDDAKRHLNITTDDDDLLITDKIAVATTWINTYTGYTPATVVETVTDTEMEIAVIASPTKEACRQLVGHLYANREASLIGVSAQVLPFGLLDLLAPYRAYAF